MDEKKLFCKNDWLLILLLLFVSGAALLFFVASHAPGYRVRISVAGEEVQIVSLDKNGSVKVQTGENEQDYNLVVIENGSVWVDEANCSNQICVEHAPISKVGETIICLPHKVVVTIIE